MKEESRNTKRSISGIVRTTTKPVSPEESEKRIQDLYDERFSPFQICEGSRHGNCFFPMDREE